MKKYALLLSAFLVCIKVAATTEYPIDFSVSTLEHDMSFKIVSSVNKTVSLSGDQEYDDGDYYYDPAVTLKLGVIPYNLIIPETVSNENISYNVVAIDNGAFGNGSRTSTDRVTIHYLSMDNVSSIYSLTLPSTITSINSMPNQIKILKCCATTPPALNKSIPSSCSVIYVPISSLSAYKSASVWSNYADKMVGYDPSTNLISDISFSQKTYTTNTVSTIQLAPSVIPSASASNITWSSSDTSIATVDASGTVTGVSPGECYITATSSDGGFVFATIKITINPTPPITNITLNKTEKTIFIGDLLNTVTLIPRISPSESAGVGVTWSSSNSNVASVDQNGVVTAVAKGTATITCIANDESGKTASCQITVDELSSFSIGTGNSCTYLTPFHSSNLDNEVFVKYNANEISGAGTIRAITFEEKAGGVNSTSREMNLEIWMGKVNDANFYNSTSPSGNEKLSQMTCVFQDDIQVGNKMPYNIQKTIVLHTPFEYDGSYDLDIFIKTYFYDSSSTSIQYNYTTTSSKTVKYRGTNYSVTPSTWNWTTDTKRPNITFWFNDMLKNVNNPDVTISPIAAVTYDGSAQTPAVTVKDGNTTLIQNTDYTIAYSDNINAGTATVTITGKGDYYGTRTANFTINPKNASNLTIYSVPAVTYNGLAQRPNLMVTDGSTILTSGTHYTVAYSNNTNVGTATVTITGKGNYTGTKSANFTINAKGASNLTISEIAAVTYNGSAQTPAVTVNDTKLNTSYYTSGITKVFSNDNNININIKYLAYEQNTCSDFMCCIVVQSPSGEEMILDSRDLFNHNKLGAYCVSQDGYTFIDLQSKEAGTWHLLLVQGYAGNWYYSLSNTMPTTNSYTLQSGTDYTVSYSNNTNAGTATVTITGKGNYTGTKNANFTINPKNASNLTINSIAAQTYTGTAKTPTVTVKDGSTTLTNGTHYTVAYSNNTNAGTATVTITGMGNYTGTKNANFTINKAALTITANSYTINQGDALPAFAVSYSGFQNGETSSVLTTQPTITCDATDSETPGVYDITPSGAAATNYSFNYVKGTLTVNAVESVTIAMKAGGGAARNMIAYSSKYGLDFTDIPEIKAYIACGYNWKKEVILVHVNVVPPYTGMVIKTSNAIYDGEEYEVPITTEKYYYSNLLVPVVETRTVTPTEVIDEEEFTNFAIGTLNGGGIGFVRLTSNWTAQNKSYLRVPTRLYNNTPAARNLGGYGIEFVEGDEATAIQNIKNDALENDGDYYDLQGRKVKPLSKGIYIHNGKKVFVK